MWRLPSPARSALVVVALCRKECVPPCQRGTRGGERVAGGAGGPRAVALSKKRQKQTRAHEKNALAPAPPLTPPNVRHPLAGSGVHDAPAGAGTVPGGGSRPEQAAAVPSRGRCRGGRRGGGAFDGAPRSRGAEGGTRGEMAAAKGQGCKGAAGVGGAAQTNGFCNRAANPHASHLPLRDVPASGEASPRPRLRRFLG